MHHDIITTSVAVMEIGCFDSSAAVPVSEIVSRIAARRRLQQLHLLSLSLEVGEDTFGKLAG